MNMTKLIILAQHTIYPSWPFVCVCAWAKTPTIIGTSHAWACLLILFLYGSVCQEERDEKEMRVTSHDSQYLRCCEALVCYQKVKEKVDSSQASL